MGVFVEWCVVRAQLRFHERELAGVERRHGPMALLEWLQQRETECRDLFPDERWCPRSRRDSLVHAPTVLLRMLRRLRPWRHQSIREHSEGIAEMLHRIR